MTRLLTLLLLPLLSIAEDCEPCARNAAGEIEPPSSFGTSPTFNCGNATLQITAQYGNGTDNCKNAQLMMWQHGCCPDPPMDHCTLCSTYKEDKLIPNFVHQEFGSQKQVVTCKNVAERITYLDRDGITSQWGNCDDTERGRARAWCECQGISPFCTLQCPDGSEIPDPDKQDPLFGETCARWMYETTTLTAEACSEMEESLFFSAQKFCCNLEAPATCKICSAGKKLKTSDEKVFRDKTCADIAEYAKWLPGESCIGWFSKLVDDPIDPVSTCCDPDDGAPADPANPSSDSSRIGTMITTVLGVSMLVGLVML